MFASRVLIVIVPEVVTIFLPSIRFSSSGVFVAIRSITFFSSASFSVMEILLRQLLLPTVHYVSLFCNASDKCGRIVSHFFIHYGILLTLHINRMCRTYVCSGGHGRNRAASVIKTPAEPAWAPPEKRKPLQVKETPEYR